MYSGHWIAENDECSHEWKLLTCCTSHSEFCSFQFCLHVVQLIARVVNFSRSACKLYIGANYTFFRGCRCFMKRKRLRIKKIIVERLKTDLVCRWRCPDNSFADVSFVIVAYGERAVEDFFFLLLNFKWPLQKLSSTLSLVHSCPLTLKMSSTLQRCVELNSTQTPRWLKWPHFSHFLRFPAASSNFSHLNSSILQVF